MIELTLPVGEREIRRLKIGDLVSLSGVAITARDAAHKYMVEKLIEGTVTEEEDVKLLRELKATLKDGAIYHSGPIVKKVEGKWVFVSAGPTTSIRDEIYEDKVIKHFQVRCIIGKGGMGERTLAACSEVGAVYLHGIGGAGVLNALSVVEVINVFKAEEFGLPEAFWKIRLSHFRGIVTMDAHGQSLHKNLSSFIDKNLKEIRGL